MGQPTVASQSPKADLNTPLWSTDLERIEPFERFLYSSVMISPQVVFVDNNRLAVSFLDPCVAPSGESSPHLKVRVAKTQCPLTLNSLFIDTNSGDVEHTIAIPFHTLHQSTPSSPPGQGLRLLIPTRAGEFVAHTGDFLLRYDSKLELMQKHSIGNPDRTVAFVSPGGGLVMLSEFEDVGKFQKLVFPSDNIESGALFGKGWPAEGLTDDGTVLSYVLRGNLSDAQSSDSRRVSSGKEKCMSLRGPFCLALCAGENSCRILGGDGRLVTSKVFAIGKGTHAYELVDELGNVLYRGYTIDPIHAFYPGPASAERLALSASRTEGRHRQWETKFTFEVLDLKNMRSVFKVTVAGIGLTNRAGGRTFRSSDVAVSSDGSMLAILLDSQLRLYRLPGKN